MGAQPTDLVASLIDAVTSAPEELPLAAITDLHKSGHDVQVDATEARVIAMISRRPDGRLTALTPREKQVATVVAAGYSNRQIAVALSITLATVKDHVHSILSKTGFQSRAELIAAWYGGLESHGQYR